jgi:hypothetical protein
MRTNPWRWSSTARSATSGSSAAGTVPNRSTFRAPTSAWRPSPATTGAVWVAVATIISLIAGGSFRDEVTVPDVIGLEVHSAYDELREAGFAIGIEEPIATGAPSVTEQSVAPGRTAPRGGIIVLELSKSGGGFLGLLHPGGFTERMPNLVGKSLPEAAETLAHEGLQWGRGPLPALPAGTEPTLLHNYEVSVQVPKPGRPFTATIWRETAEGGLFTETTTVGLSAKLRERS